MQADWFTRWVMPVFGAACLVGGVISFRGPGDDWEFGVMVTSFGLTMLCAYPLLVATSHEGRPYLSRTSRPKGRALVFPYSRWRGWAAAASSFFFSVTGIALAAGAGGFSGRHPPWLVRGAGILCAAFFGLAFVATLRTARGARLALTPQGISNRQGFLGSVIPWEAIEKVEVTGFGSEDFIVVEVSDESHVHTSGGERLLMAVNRRLLGDAEEGGAQDPPWSVTYPARYLEADPDLIVKVIRHYLQSPEQRTELGTEASLRRVEELRSS